MTRVFNDNGDLLDCIMIILGKNDYDAEIYLYAFKCVDGNMYIQYHSTKKEHKL